MKETSDEWEKQTGTDMWLPEKENDEITGEVTHIVEGLYGNQLVLKTPSGKELKTPSHKVLQARCAGLKVGDNIRIVYLEEQPPKVRGQNPTKMYEVYKKK